MNFKKFLTIPALILGLLVVFHLSRSIVDIYGWRGRVSGLMEEIAVLEGEKTGLEEERTFRQTEEFVEREARDKLRMTREGEHILVLPGGQDEEIPLNHKGSGQANSKIQIPNSEEEPSWERWVEYWFD